MDSSYINQVPMPACIVDENGIITSANALIKNVFPYEDISGSKFFALTGVKRDELFKVNEEENIIERNDRLFRLRTYDSQEDNLIVVFFDTVTYFVLCSAFRANIYIRTIFFLYVESYGAVTLFATPNKE